MGRHNLEAELAPPPTDAGETAGHRSGYHSGYQTGYHRADGMPGIGRRRIAKWPIVSGVFVVLLVAGLIAWGWANNVLNARAEAQASGCSDGSSTMRIVVAPAAEQPVAAAAAKWNEAKTVVRSSCVHVVVQSVDSGRVYDALTGRSDLDSIGGLPAAWICDSADSASRLAAARPDLIGAPAEPVAGYSFVGLGGTAVDEVGVRAAQVFRDFLQQPAQQTAFKS